MTKFRKFERKKTERFLARPPHQNILPFPEADRREAEGKKKLKSFKRGRERLRIGQIWDAKVQKTDRKKEILTVHKVITKRSQKIR